MSKHQRIHVTIAARGTLAGCGKTDDFSEIRNPHYAEFKMGRV